MNFKLIKFINALPKKEILIVILVSALLVHITSAKVQFQADCMPPLRYELPKGTSFLSMNITDESKDVAIKKGLTPRVAFQESPGEVDMDEAIHTKNAFSYFKSDHIQLLGPVMFYKKSPLGAFDTSMTYLYSKIHDQHAWVSSTQLTTLLFDFSNPINQANQKIIKERVDTPILLENSLNCEASHGDVNNNEVEQP